MPQYKLIYFNVKGRAELARLLFAYAGVEYEDHRFEKEKWPEIKPSMTFGQVPVLEIDGKQLPQSYAIARYLAREFKLLGKDNLEAAFADAYVDVIADITNAMTPVFREPDEEKKKEIGAKIYKETVKPLLEKMEVVLDKNGTGYLVGDSLTWADLAYFALLDMISSRFGPASLQGLPNLQKLHKTVGEISQIKEWIEKRPVTAM